MSTIKVDTIATRTGSGNITASNTIAGTSATLSGTLAVTGTTTTAAITSSGRHDVNFNGSGTQAFKYTDTGGGNLASFGQFYNPSNSLIGNIQNANNTGVHMCVGTNGSVVFDQIGYTAANALDDYEEGSWTPVCGTPGVTGSYSVQLGRYVKIGDFCHLIFNLTINSAYTGSTGASFTIGGLPFATRAYDASLYAGGHIGYYFNINHTDTGRTLVYQIPSGSSLTMELKGVGDNIGEQLVSPAMMGTNAVIRGSISYHTA